MTCPPFHAATEWTSKTFPWSAVTSRFSLMCAEEVELSEDEPESNDVDKIDPFSEDESDTD